MELVADTNCLISALIFPGKSREIICSFGISLYAPEEIISESLAHKEEIIQKSGISSEDFDLLFNILLSNIKITPEISYRDFKEQAKRLVTHIEDSPFMALALFIHIPIWSDDKDLKKQNIVKIISTSELIEMLDKSEDEK